MMRSHRTLDGPDNASRRRELLDAMYVSKTQQRLVDVKKDIRLVDLMGESVSINGALCLGLEGATSVLQRVVDAAGLCEAEYLSVVHGDMCLSNILFDRRTSIVRLIDPRGSFGSSFSIYGDARYDLAKLSHSILGDYDHLVHGLFDCTVGNEGAYLQAHVSQRQQAVKNQFDKWLKATTGIEDAQVRLIESLLFLSMVPLHADNSRSQMAFLVRGLEMFSTSARRFGCWHPRTESAPAIQIHA
jgi:hypothetical protein